MNVLNQTHVDQSTIDFADPMTYVYTWVWLIGLGIALKIVAAIQGKWITTIKKNYYNPWEYGNLRQDQEKLVYVLGKRIGAELTIVRVSITLWVMSLIAAVPVSLVHALEKKETKAYTDVSLMNKENIPEITANISDIYAETKWTKVVIKDAVVQMEEEMGKEEKGEKIHIAAETMSVAHMLTEYQFIDETTQQVEEIFGTVLRQTADKNGYHIAKERARVLAVVYTTAKEKWLHNPFHSIEDPKGFYNAYLQPENYAKTYGTAHVSTEKRIQHMVCILTCNE